MPDGTVSAGRFFLLSGILKPGHTRGKMLTRKGIVSTYDPMCADAYEIMEKCSRPGRKCALSVGHRRRRLCFHQAEGKAESVGCVPVERPGGYGWILRKRSCWQHCPWHWRQSVWRAVERTAGSRRHSTNGCQQQFQVIRARQYGIVSDGCQQQFQVTRSRQYGAVCSGSLRRFRVR